MAAHKTSNIAIVGIDAAAISMVCLDLPDDETALEVGKRIAAETGRKVKVCDGAGKILGVFKSATRN